MNHTSGLIPELTNRLEDALAVLRRDGAALYESVGKSGEDAVNLAHSIFKENVRSIPEAARVFVGGEMDRYEQPDHHFPLLPHTDGFAYGDLFPDYIMLTCVKASPEGGESYLVDGYAVLDDIARLDPSIADDLQSVAVDQTEEDMQVSHSPIVQRNADGRKLLRRNFCQRPLPGSARPAQDQKMIDTWVNAVDAAGKSVPRFRIEPGQALILDNYRMLHAREGYTDPERMMWRVWVWTHEALGVPDMPLHSDSRFAQR